MTTGDLWVYEGGTWNLAARVAQPFPMGKQSGLFGWSVAIADLDEDGVLDLVAGAPGKTGQRTGVILAGEVQVFYGPDFTRWKSLLPPYEVKQARYGDQVDVLDLDLDGQQELLIAATGATWGSGAPKPQGVVEVRGTPSFLREGELVPGYQSGMPYSRAFGTSLAHGDLNGDGAQDLLIGAPVHKIPGGYNSFCWAYVQIPQFDLGLDGLLLRQDVGGSVNLRLDAGSARASQPYLLLASSSGTVPGYGIGGTHVPLNPDPLQSLLLTIVGSGGGAPYLVGWQGILDKSGRASAALTLPVSAFPGLVGTTMSFAYLAGSTYDYASMPVSVEIVRGPYRGGVVEDGSPNPSSRSRNAVIVRKRWSRVPLPWIEWVLRG